MSLLDHLHGRAIFPPRYAWFLEGPWRRLLLSPHRLAQLLPLSPQVTVLEIGAGGGYYARPLSGLVQGSHLLLPVQGDAGRLPIANQSVDVVIAVTVLGEVPSAEATIAEVQRVLRPGGLFSVSEHWPDPDFLSFAEVAALCQGAGFHLQRRFGARFNYTAVFRT